MASFLIRRAIQGVVTLWVTWSLVFVLYFVAPEDPAQMMVSRGATPAMIERIRVSLGLTRPIWQQYLDFFGRIIHGDLGYSFTSGAPVSTIITRALPVDISLAIPAAAIWLAVGLGIGFMAALQPRSRRAIGATVFVLAGLSVPTFLFGISLIYLFDGLLVHWLNFFPLPGENWTPIQVNPVEWAHGLILPWITLAFASAATYVRLSRSSLLDVLGLEYITAARARGLSERRVLYVHALRAAAPPLITQFGIDLAAILGGTIITEVVFGLPGLGRALIGAVESQNLPVVQGVVVATSAFVVVVNIVVDGLYVALDPRVRTA